MTLGCRPSRGTRRTERDTQQTPRITRARTDRRAPAQRSTGVGVYTDLDAAPDMATDTAWLSGTSPQQGDIASDGRATDTPFRECAQAFSAGAMAHNEDGTHPSSGRVPADGMAQDKDDEYPSTGDTGAPLQHGDVDLAAAMRTSNVNYHSMGYRGDLLEWMARTEAEETVRDARRAFDMGRVAHPVPPSVMAARGGSANTMEPATDDEIPSLTSASTDTSSEDGARR